MSEIGARMFKGGAIGGGVGFVAGMVKGIHDVKEAQGQVAESSYTLPAYDRPVQDTVYIDYGTRSPQELNQPDLRKFDDGYVRNPDGSVKMEHVPAHTVKGRGTPQLTWKEHKMEEPFVRLVEEETDTRIETYTDSDGDLQTRTVTDTDTDTHYFTKNLGTWREPVVNFADGVSRAGIMMKNIGIFTALGIGLGALGGAIYHVAIGDR